MEAFATKLGLPTPDLSVKQRALKVSRLTATSGAAVGVVVGCLLGMGTLLFLDTTQAEREKKQVRYNGGVRSLSVVFPCLFTRYYAGTLGEHIMASKPIPLCT